jgi:hypothetical protein
MARQQLLVDENDGYGIKLSIADRRQGAAVNAAAICDMRMPLLMTGLVKRVAPATMAVNGTCCCGCLLFFFNFIIFAASAKVESINAT